jgi:predicted Rossmann fold flavoprotein
MISSKLEQEKFLFTPPTIKHRMNVMTKDKSEQFDVIIIGAGGAGLMCAIEAGKRGRKVLVLEHNDALGKKIRISGGGRCNFTNIHAAPKNYLSQNPHFIKSPLSRYTPQNFCDLVNKYKIAFHEKKLGQLFCDKSSQDIIAMLKKECEHNNVKISLDVKVTGIQKHDDFELETTQGLLACQGLVIATGALSIPNLGATDFGYNIAKQFEIKVNPCRPGLVPLTFKQNDLKIFAELSGVSVDAIVSFESVSFRENILFTHRGLSGPAILQISSYWLPGKPIVINLLPDAKMSTIFKEHHIDKSSLKNFLKNYLPSRLTDILCEHFFENKPLNQYSTKQLQDIAQFLNHWEVTPQGTEGYAKAEVTVGGVDTDELSSKTMEAHKVPGLYFIGEVVDITGHLGGFNFQWAWASGYAAGQYV